MYEVLSMYKKKLIACGLALALVIGFFPFIPGNHVNAYQYPNFESSYVNSSQVNGVTCTAYLGQCSAVLSSNVNSVSSGEIGFLVNIQYYNNNSTNALVNGAGFDIRVVDGSLEPIITRVETITSDLMPGTYSSGWWSINPSGQFAYGNGFVIPAKSSLYMTCIVYCEAQFGYNNSTGAGYITNPVLSSDAMRLKTFTVSASNTYSYIGDPQSLSDINVAVDIALDNIEYTGNIWSFNSSNSLSYRYNDYPVNSSLHLIVDRTIGKPILIASDQILDSTNDTNIVNATVRYPVQIGIYINNNSTNQFRNRSYNTLRNIVPVGVGFTIDEYTSNYWGSYYYLESGSTSRIELYADNLIDGYAYISGNDTLVAFIVGHIDVPYGTSVSFSNADVSVFYPSYITSVYNDIYYPHNEWSAIRDIYESFNNTTNSDNAAASEELAGQADNIHSQEQSYYQQNASAIESTGLKNYRFSGDQQNGISAVSNDFTDLWNALGSWNSVYIFSLTLGLALTILRHAPHGIRKRKTSNSSSEGS